MGEDESGSFPDLRSSLKLWPQGRLCEAIPFRINFVNIALVNFDVPVALVTTTQFYAAQRAVER